MINNSRGRQRFAETLRWRQPTFANVVGAKHFSPLHCDVSAKGFHPPSPTF
ncbi:MAG: hypothetical protein LBU34_13950 [Planctomycetaceae bacterium]|nr:hypothetical protein [Planctomycetaceae bacterium]